MKLYRVIYLNHEGKEAQMFTTSKARTGAIRKNIYSTYGRQNVIKTEPVEINTSRHGLTDWLNRFCKYYIPIILIFIMMIGVSQAQEPPTEPPKPEAITFEWPGAKCDLINYVQTQNGSTRVLKVFNLDDADAMICQTDYQVIFGTDAVNDRLMTYGSIKATQDRAGNAKKEYDLSNDKYLTAAGRELYKSIMSVRIGKLFVVYQCIIGPQNIVTITAIDRVRWDESLTDPIQAAFEKAAKIDAAVE